MTDYLKSIDKSLKELVKLMKGEEDVVTYGEPKRLMEPVDAQHKAWNEIAAQNTRDRAQKNVKRLTEPGDPVTGGEGEYLLDPSEAGDK